MISSHVFLDFVLYNIRIASFQADRSVMLHIGDHLFDSRFFVGVRPVEDLPDFLEIQSLFYAFFENSVRDSEVTQTFLAEIELCLENSQVVFNVDFANEIK